MLALSEKSNPVTSCYVSKAIGWMKVASQPDWCFTFASSARESQWKILTKQFLKRQRPKSRIRWFQLDFSIMDMALSTILLAGGSHWSYRGTVSQETPANFFVETFLMVVASQVIMPIIWLFIAFVKFTQPEYEYQYEYKFMNRNI